MKPTLYAACVDVGAGSQIVREGDYCCENPRYHTWEGFSAAKSRAITALRVERAEIMSHIGTIQDQRVSDWDDT